MALSFRRLGDRFRRYLQRPGTVNIAPYQAILAAIDDRESALHDLDDDGLAKAFDEIRGGEEPDRVEICALAREAARRGLDQRPFDVQIVGALAMLDRRVIEMATGEGKTLAAAIAVAGFAAQGQQVHVLTVNDYLAHRDAEWMRPVYELLGLSVASITQSSTPEERREAYTADVTYVTVAEAGFDYLRDRLVTDVNDIVQTDFAVAIVDEADSLLIDEARVPLVLAGAVIDAEDDSAPVAELVRRLRPGLDYQIAEDGRNVQLTTRGLESVEKSLGDINLYDQDNLGQLTAVNLALHAEVLLRRDVDYIVRDGKVRLVNEFRGRVAELQRWPDGLQAAVEAKEALESTAEGEVLSTITVQSLVKLYPLVCGMTGTAVVAGEELREFYDLEVAVIPPNTPCVRTDQPDQVYATVTDKEEALIAEVAQAHEAGRPVLIGTLDVAESERLAERLRERDLDCAVLNAKNDAEEAAIIAEAGTFGTITVSTQIAGRGTDIRLGGSDMHDRDRVADLGGLYIIGNGRNESRRVDDQLRGRSGRQGDPGESVFFVSVEDELIRRYGEDALPPPQLPDEDGQLRDPALQKAIEHAQKVSEGANLEIHRNTWRYNYLIEEQRKVLHAQRDEVLRTSVAAERLDAACPERYDELLDTIGEDAIVHAARQIALYHLDRAWSDHLAHLTEIREGVHLRALGRLDPLDEFHRASIPAFEELQAEVNEQIKQSFNEVEITADGPAMGDAGLMRPTSTWTYVVHENPFGSEMERAFGSLRRHRH